MTNTRVLDLGIRSVGQNTADGAYSGQTEGEPRNLSRRFSLSNQSELITGSNPTAGCGRPTSPSSRADKGVDATTGEFLVADQAIRSAIQTAILAEVHRPICRHAASQCALRLQSCTPPLVSLHRGSATVFRRLRSSCCCLSVPAGSGRLTALGLVAWRGRSARRCAECFFLYGSLLGHLCPHTIPYLTVHTNSGSWLGWRQNEFSGLKPTPHEGILKWNRPS
ncbi:hypothetical protein VTK73DRAFT_285 [Phialemonium thermophilum]|uniref:Uncharacterized protein n=1 Tax=Phialemonium thermophilum TaxID=223376 RepID=A0ABR3VVZ3_9PEZI